MKLASGYVDDPQKYTQASIATYGDVRVNLEFNDGRFEAVPSYFWTNDEVFPLESVVWHNQLINCTPHEISIHHAGAVTILPPTGFSIRCSQINEDDGVIMGLPVNKVRFGYVEHLPPQLEGIYWLASRIVLMALNGSRPDIIGTGEAIRDDKGNVIGCKGLAR